MFKNEEEMFGSTSGFLLDEGTRLNDLSFFIFKHLPGEK